MMNDTFLYIRNKVFSYPYLDSFTCYYTFDKIDSTLYRMNNIVQSLTPIIKNQYLSLICEASTLSKNSSLLHYFSSKDNVEGDVRGSDLLFLQEGLKFVHSLIKKESYDIRHLKLNRGVLIHNFEQIQEITKKYISASNEYTNKHINLEMQVVSRLSELHKIMQQACLDLGVKEDYIFGLHEQLCFYIHQYYLLYNKVYNSYLRVVYKEAKSIVKSKMDAFPNAFQNGAKGLMKAMSYFDTSKGYSFKTYASQWIRKSILEESEKEVNLIQTSNSTWRKFRKFEKIKHKNHNPYIRDFNYIADTLNCSVRTIEAVYKDIDHKSVTSLDSPLGVTGSGEERTLLDKLSQNTFEVEVQDPLINVALLGTGLKKKIMFLLFGLVDETPNTSKILHTRIRDEKVRQFFHKH